MGYYKRCLTELLTRLSGVSLPPRRLLQGLQLLVVVAGLKSCICLTFQRETIASLQLLLTLLRCQESVDCFLTLQMSCRWTNLQTSTTPSGTRLSMFCWQTSHVRLMEWLYVPNMLFTLSLVLCL